MMQALYAVAQGCLIRFGVAGLLLLLWAPAAGAGTSNQQNPVVTFATPGAKQVILEVCNNAGCSSVTKAISVLNPVPVVTSAAFTPLLPEAGQLVLVTGAGTGKPPLAFSWEAAATGGPPFVGFPGATAWWNTAGLPPGAYTLSLHIQNGSGTAVSALPIILAPAADLAFYTVAPCRLYDSRQGPLPIPSGAAQVIQGSGTCGIPVGARALAANVTVINPTGTGYAVLYPGNYPQPVASTVNFTAGITRANHAILPLATDGVGTLTALLSVAAANGSADLTVDVSGYFMP
jgi:hypothetical protein